jgi:hypothetical protein
MKINVRNFHRGFRCPSPRGGLWGDEAPLALWEWRKAER